jgi:hypothetical protein
VTTGNKGNIFCQGEMLEVTVLQVDHNEDGWNCTLRIDSDKCAIVCDSKNVLAVHE